MKLACIALLFTCLLTQTLLLGQDKVRNLTPVYKTTKDSLPVNNTTKGKYHIKIYYNFSLASDKRVTESISNNQIITTESINANFGMVSVGFAIEKPKSIHEIELSKIGFKKEEYETTILNLDLDLN